MNIVTFRGVTYNLCKTNVISPIKNFSLAVRPVPVTTTQELELPQFASKSYREDTVIVSCPEDRHIIIVMALG